MDNRSLNTGGFTLPGEAGYETLTLELAKKWGADVIRDSDGTQLSDEIIESDYDIYSTLCLVRADNEWAKANRSKLQQCCVMSRPVTAATGSVTVDLLDGYFKEQLVINSDDDPKEWWQVFDRTTGEEVDVADWSFDHENGSVTIRETVKWHRYTVNFFCYRIWEEISMYNHVTNDWGDKEHLMPIDPIYPEARDQIRSYLTRWLEEHPHTKVVRLTSMFYNFWWFWGDPDKQKFIVNDWGSYEFSVSTGAILQFEEEKGYRPKSEDFVNGGLYNNSYKVPSELYRDWMDFVNTFVVEFGKECIEMIHAAGKLAFVFYNDHWIGIEPYNERFKEFGFDGIIDGIFNGFEARKVAECPAVSVREIRMHPYLFPTGVNGEPSFLPGGKPTDECKRYWTDIRRALLRKGVDRIGFGGYLHLVENHPDFVDYIETLGSEFRELRNLHLEGPSEMLPVKVALLTGWGNTRAWACCGHFNKGNYYNEVMESMSGLSVETVFVSFDDIINKGSIDSSIDVVINAGLVDDAWSGGKYWSDPRIVEALSDFVASGGGLIGVGEPTAQRHSSQYFQLSHALGVDRELGRTRAFNRFAFEDNSKHFILEDIHGDLDLGKSVDGIYLFDTNTEVLASVSGSPTLAVKTFEKGRCVYLAGYQYDAANVRLLLRAILWSVGKESLLKHWQCSNFHTECAYYPQSSKLVVINNSNTSQETVVHSPNGDHAVSLMANESKVIDLS
ncbi:1,3-beta-galactosyl-N-acetylhexosamine phosphorylase [Pelagicoccus sp. SDUM812002]|uniref:1,3-beta-galactosyl-N-acetylhexosamine phosphorylase n=1 Tax=Pelagicoccus sp. SDUM812002 TaxID=3041266 RepID=UPI0028102C36|nr:1,3-beta-galactosyl-N-acetylhexosamine phosphorylase [Pelagicoccus sp. SDUM812002]MDQ8184029.1 1,3-beta-galactosyl-N-acetylhexosamine phosphorylase [Pelagicoccus sp. SDUM812002]